MFENKYRLRVFCFLWLVLMYAFHFAALSDAGIRFLKVSAPWLWWWDGFGYIVTALVAATAGGLSYAAQRILFVGIKDAEAK